KTITVSVVGDIGYEPAESFLVDLSNPTNATVVAGQGTGTIVNDDPLPSIAIAGVSANEGNSGTTPFGFTVSLSNPSYQAVTFYYATVAATATDGVDYQTTSGTLTFAPGETSKTITVAVNGDTTDEPDETFSVVLSNPGDATIGAGTGTGTIG